MRTNTPHLPVRWYLASLVGALLLACLLVGVFEIIARDDVIVPDNVAGSEGLPARPSATEGSVSSISSVAPVTLPVVKPAEPPPSRSEEPAPELKPKRLRSLWSMVAPPAVQAGAGVIALLATLAAVLQQLLLRRRGPA
jgi:hypothetical protein